MRIWPKPCHLICCELQQRAYVTVEAGEVSAVHRWCGTLKIQVIQGQQTVQWKNHFQSTDTWKEVGSCSPHLTSKSFQSANTSKSFWINAQVGSSRLKMLKEAQGQTNDNDNGLTRSGQDANMAANEIPMAHGSHQMADFEPTLQKQSLRFLPIAEMWEHSEAVYLVWQFEGPQRVATSFKLQFVEVPLLRECQLQKHHGKVSCLSQCMQHLTQERFSSTAPAKSIIYKVGHLISRSPSLDLLVAGHCFRELSQFFASFAVQSLRSKTPGQTKWSRVNESTTSSIKFLYFIHVPFGQHPLLWIPWSPWVNLHGIPFRSPWQQDTGKSHWGLKKQCRTAELLGKWALGFNMSAFCSWFVTPDLKFSLFCRTCTLGATTKERHFGNSHFVSANKQVNVAQSYVAMAMDQDLVPWCFAKIALKWTFIPQK